MVSGSSGPHGPSGPRLLWAQGKKTCIGRRCNGTPSSGARGPHLRIPVGLGIHGNGVPSSAHTIQRVSPLIIVHVIRWLCLHVRFLMALGASFNQPTPLSLRCPQILSSRIYMGSFSFFELLTSQGME